MAETNQNSIWDDIYKDDEQDSLLNKTPIANTISPKVETEKKITDGIRALKSQTDETIFKAISLKLDLMKVDYNTPCMNCGKTYPKGETELKQDVKTAQYKQRESEKKYKPEPIDD